MKRILIVIKSDGIGGVERRLSGLLDACRQRAIECDIVALGASPVPNGLLAEHARISELASTWSMLPLRRIHQLVQLRALLRGGTAYDLAMAFGPSPNALLALARDPRTVTVVSENGNPFVAHRKAWNAAMMWTYRRADALVVLTQDLAEDLRAAGLGPRMILSSRPRLSADVRLVTPSSPRSHTIVTVGRLVPSKRVSDLITAFASLAGRFPEWKLLIVGDGSERDALQAQVGTCGLGDRVTFTGFVRNPWQQMAEASIFVLCSAHEGLSNVLIEAAASGCALVSSDCRYGPRELLDHGKRGLLYPVGDVVALTRGLAGLMEDRSERLGIAERAYESAKVHCASATEDSLLDQLVTLVPGRRV